ncbi:MAG: hypothetical protein KAU95_03420 [Candidatus Aenigmarchaeota archaeon]|nr:hypothetical protein [Candidatus Aenigmarchaeota archaeon]
MREYKEIYGRPKLWLPKFTLKSGDQTSTHYCPGCGHGILHRILGSVVDELGIRDDVIVVNPVGCAVFIYYYLDCDHIQAPHGRASAVAVGAKRYNPEKIVISYQGDGDLAAIGTAEIVNAARRGDNISVIFVNNAIYGMTGGQVAPTTLPGQITSTTPYGCDPKNTGSPFKMSEMLAVLDGTNYIERVGLFNSIEIKKTERAIKKVLVNQMENKGFSLVEVLSNCPTNWKMNPVDSMKWIKDNMLKYFPIGVIKDNGKINREMVCKERVCEEKTCEKVYKEGE